MYARALWQKHRVKRIQDNRQDHQHIPLHEGEIQQGVPLPSQHNHTGAGDADGYPEQLDPKHLFTVQAHRRQDNNGRHGRLNQRSIDGSGGMHGRIKQGVETRNPQHG